MPIFASLLGHSLDELGITVCNVGGVNFRPYVKLAEALKLPIALSPTGILSMESVARHAHHSWPASPHACAIGKMGSNGPCRV
ncbi:ATP-dependent endonuclease [Mesorhizobium sp. M0027]|uniref:ATP-dependent endonuclease n=1 Tax=Mesorhizobium sp. M0027 TaxID=2956848 RepID=UPI00333BA8BB